MKFESFLAETIKIIDNQNLFEKSGRTIVGHTITGNSIKSSDGSSTALSKQKIFKAIKHMDLSVRRRTRVLTSSYNVEMCGFNMSKSELYFVADGSLFMIRYEVSKKGSSVLQHMYKGHLDGNRIAFHRFSK